MTHPRIVIDCERCRQPKDRSAYYVIDREYDRELRKYTATIRDTVCRRCRGAEGRGLPTLRMEEHRLLKKLDRVRGLIAQREGVEDDRRDDGA